MTTPNNDQIREAWDRVLPDGDVNAVKAWLDDRTGTVPPPHEAIRRMLLAPRVHHQLVNGTARTPGNAQRAYVTRLRGAS
jgi:hypothetical protein